MKTQDSGLQTQAYQALACPLPGNNENGRHKGHKATKNPLTRRRPDLRNPLCLCAFVLKLCVLLVKSLRIHCSLRDE